MLGISLNLGLDIGYKQGRFFKALLTKDLEFVLSERSNLIALNLGLVLLPAEVDSISEEQGRKRNALMARGTGRVEMILALSTEVVAHHM